MKTVTIAKLLKQKMIKVDKEQMDELKANDEHIEGDVYYLVADPFVIMADTGHSISEVIELQTWKVNGKTKTMLICNCHHGEVEVPNSFKVSISKACTV